jgi:hypothetical protein
MEIPASAAPFFQEYDFSQLNIRDHASLIIERILSDGDRNDAGDSLFFAA